MSLINMYETKTNQQKNKLWHLHEIKKDLTVSLSVNNTQNTPEEQLELFYSVKNLLQSKMVLLHFSKVNGQERLMLGTKNIDLAKTLFPYVVEESLGKVNGREDELRRNLSVLDVFIGEGRVFSTNRLLHFAVYTGPLDNASLLRWMDEITKDWDIKETEEPKIF